MTLKVKKLPYAREVLSNGLTTLVYPMEKTEAVSLIARIHSGQLYDAERGLAHVVEHFLFSGTKSFPRSRDVFEEIEGLGADFGGTTSDTAIEIYLHLPRKNLERGLVLLSEMIFAPSLPLGEVEKVRGTVLQERRNRLDKPDYRFQTKIDQERIGDPNHPYVREESIDLLQNFNLGDVAGFYKKFFQPQQIVLGIGGRVVAENVLSLTRNLFGSEVKGSFISEPVFSTGKYGGKKIIIHNEAKTQAHLSITFPAYGWREVDRKSRLVSVMASRIFGNGTVSRLWRALREDTGWVYHMSSKVGMWSYLGALWIQTTCETEKLDDVCKAIRKEADKYLEDGPTDKELELAKEHSLGRLTIGFEGSFGATDYFVDQEFAQEGIMLLEDRIKMVESVTKKEVHQMTKRLFDWDRVQVGLMNDFKVISQDQFKRSVEKIF